MVLLSEGVIFRISDISETVWNFKKLFLSKQNNFAEHVTLKNPNPWNSNHRECIFGNDILIFGASLIFEIGVVHLRMFTSENPSTKLNFDERKKNRVIFFLSYI